MPTHGPDFEVQWQNYIGMYPELRRRAVPQPELSSRSLSNDSGVPPQWSRLVLNDQIWLTSECTHQSTTHSTIIT